MIAERLGKLQPYVIGIRYNQGVALVDVVFKKEWTVPELEMVKYTKDVKTPGYYMFYSENPDITIDIMLDFIEEIIKLNIEREEKREYLKLKIEELKLLFNETPLELLKCMEFKIPNDIDVIQKDDIELNKTSLITLTTNTIKENNAVVTDTNINNKNKQNTKNKFNSEKIGNIDLPPKENSDGSCNCGPNEACEKCINDKGL